MKKKKYIIIIGFIIFGLLSIIILKTDIVPRVKHKLLKKTNKESPANLMNGVGDIYGIDISHHQGKIEWKKVKKWKNKKLDFVYIKATEGSTYVDITYKNNIEEAKANDFIVGSYHYFRTTSSIEDQFQNFINTIDENQQDLIPLIDVEEKTNWTGIEFHKKFQEFLNMVEDHFGKKPMIYTVNSFYNLNLAGRYKEYHFLIGRYGENAPNMRDKSNWTVWQFSETGKVDGIPKLVDIDVINHKYKLQDLLLK
jgi:lysozyme